jgi:L-aspartate oxidase
VSCTGVHGANRLASNSLLEGLVFGHRIAADLAEGLPPQADPVQRSGPPGLLAPDARLFVQGAMTAGAGVVRTATSLATAATCLDQLVEERRAGAPTTEAWETANLHTVATTLVGHATLREETRGGHWREDHPDRDDLRWRGHLVSVLDTDGNLHTRFEELP